MDLNAGVPSSRGAAHNREQPTLATVRFTRIQILRSPKRCVESHDKSPNQNGNHHVQPNVGQNQGYDRNYGEDHQNEAVVDCTVENDQGIVAEEVEEEPGDEDDQEDDHGDWVP